MQDMMYRCMCTTSLCHCQEGGVHGANVRGTCRVAITEAAAAAAAE
jgi:hypothetical protein